MEEICRAAVKTMVDLINGRPVEQEQTIPASFVLRDSAKV
jgi:DNA-binding LacI/PurR family transcriptional regulator